MRGQTEQMLLIKVLDDGDPIDFKQVKLSELVSEYLTPIAETWAAAESAIVVPPDRPAVDTPELLAESVAKGAELFRGAKAQCAKCHGPTALGDGSEELLFDDWNKVKQFADLAKKIADAEAIEDRKERSETLSDLQTKLAAEDYKWILPQQQIQPRNLRLGNVSVRTPAGRSLPADLRRCQRYADAAGGSRREQSERAHAGGNLAHCRLCPLAALRQDERAGSRQGKAGRTQCMARVKLRTQSVRRRRRT